MPRHTPPRFRKTLLAMAAGAALAPWSAWALDLSEAPPGTVEPYVRPNVIISVDDSGSMDFCIEEKKSGADKCTKDGNGWLNVGVSDRTEPVDGVWPANSRRVNVLRHALIGINGVGGIIRDTTLLPDKQIRLSWQAMHNNGNTSGAKNVDSTTMNTNSMRVLDITHRNNFISFIKNLDPKNGTPSHLMFSQADSYMRRPLGTNSAWASNPGTTGEPYLACRRSYHIMMTDGRWNGDKKQVSDKNKRDNATNLTLPDGNVYGGTTAAQQAKTNLYRDKIDDTLADWAFYSWAQPMQTTGMTGSMQPSADYRKAPATENFGTTNTPAVLERYWNPRYNPATWPHMVTYTIGFSDEAVTWPGVSNPTIEAPLEKVPFGYTGSFPDLVRGTKTWPEMDNENKRSLDLWHAALNGRGRFYAVEKGEDLEKAFREIFGQINTATDPDLSSSATSGSNVSRSDVGKYVASYEPLKSWKGFLTAEKVKTDGTTVSDPGWEGKNTADKIDAMNVSSRLILSWGDKWVSTQSKGGVPFKWASDESNLSTAQKLWLKTSVGGAVEADTKGQQRLDYIRGERGLEGSETNGYTTAKPYRQRYSAQGDIINSDVWYTGAPAGDSLLKGYSSFIRNNKSRPGMLYVGGNDGMLHGFAAADGQEKIAYVPRGMIPGLSLLTDPQYNNKHKYFVDGSPMTGDVDMNGGMQDPTSSGYGDYAPDWRTLLVGSLGLGGKGYFVLDVTNPTATTLPNGILGFAEANASSLVKLDRTRGPAEPAPNCGAMTAGAEKTACLKTVEEDKDIGYITAKPMRDDNDPMRSTQITRMNNSRWAAVMGNGYNSFNQRAVLLIQYLDGAKELVRIPTAGTVAEPPTPGTGQAKDNGLASPRLVDLNGDGMSDVVYAGDNLGNLWKFDLTSADPDKWKVAFGGSALFTASGPTALNGTTRPKVQPITAPPTTRANDRTKTVGSGANAKTVKVVGMMVSFGTGRNVDKDDPANVDVQTLYSVLDNTRYREVGTGANKRLEVHPGGGTCPSGDDCVPAPTALGAGVTAAKLARQEFVEVDGGDYGAIKPADASNELKAETWANFNGWYVDLPAVSERLLKPLEFYDASNLLTVWSQVPAKGSKVDPNIESCESTSVDTERQYRTFINIMDGKAPTVQIVDKNSDGKFNMADGDGVLVNGKYIGISRKKVTKGPHSIISAGKDTNVDIDIKNNREELAGLPEEALRPSWRQLK